MQMSRVKIRRIKELMSENTIPDILGFKSENTEAGETMRGMNFQNSDTKFCCRDEDAISLRRSAIRNRRAATMSLYM